MVMLLDSFVQTNNFNKGFPQGACKIEMFSFLKVKSKKRVTSNGGSVWDLALAGHCRQLLLTIKHFLIDFI
jgi:hypothetical protein